MQTYKGKLRSLIDVLLRRTQTGRWDKDSVQN